MNKILLILFLSLMGTATVGFGQKKVKQGVEYEVKILRVIDGDTVAFEAPFLPDPLKKELSIRVWGVDTPEKSPRSKCPGENDRAQAATAFTKNLISTGTKLQVSIMDWDKYGGRVLGDVIVDGQSLRELLIKNNLGRPYFGDAKQSWC